MFPVKRPAHQRSKVSSGSSIILLLYEFVNNYCFTSQKPLKRIDVSEISGTPADIDISSSQRTAQSSDTGPLESFSDPPSNNDSTTSSQTDSTTSARSNIAQSSRTGGSEISSAQETTTTSSFETNTTGDSEIGTSTSEETDSSNTAAPSLSNMESACLKKTASAVLLPDGDKRSPKSTVRGGGSGGDGGTAELPALPETTFQFQSDWKRLRHNWPLLVCYFKVKGLLSISTCSLHSIYLIVYSGSS